MFKISHEQVNELLTAYKSGTSITKLADKYGVRRTTIRHHLRKAGLTERDISRPAKPTAPTPTVPATKPPIPKIKKPPTIKPVKAELCELCLTRPARIVNTDEGTHYYAPCPECAKAITDPSKKFFDPPREYVQFKPLSPPKEPHE